jgi:hypothetical protein
MSDARSGKVKDRLRLAAVEGPRAGREEWNRPLTGSLRGKLVGVVIMAVVAVVAGLITGDVRALLVGLAIGPLAFAVLRSRRSTS